jgi:hypothetical protein
MKLVSIKPGVAFKLKHRSTVPCPISPTVNVFDQYEAELSNEQSVS